MRRPDEIDRYLALFTARFLQDALTEATSDYWERRARTFAAVGTETADEKALACRRQAWFICNYGTDWPSEVLHDVLAQMVDEADVFSGELGVAA